MERCPSDRLQESSPFVTCRHLGSGKPFWGVGTWGPPGQGPGVSGGIPADSLWREVWGQQALGVGWRVGCTQEAAGPLVLAASTQSCFCLSSDHPPPGDAHRTHTPQRKENRGGRGSGEARSGLTTQAHGDPRKYLQVEVPRRPEAPGVTGRYRGPQKAGSMCSQHGVGDRGESPGGMLRPRPLPAEQPAAE